MAANSLCGIIERREADVAEGLKERSPARHLPRLKALIVGVLQGAGSLRCYLVLT